MLQVGEADVLIDIKPFDLMEEAVCTGADSFVAVNTSWTDDAHLQTFARGAAFGTELAVASLADDVTIWTSMNGTTPRMPRKAESSSVPQRQRHQTAKQSTLSVLKVPAASV